MILILRALGLGDLATAVPALRALRARYPDEHLALLAPRWLAPLVELIGDIDELVDTAGLSHLRWRGPAPDLAVNLHGRGPESHRLLVGTRPRRLFAFVNRAAGHHDGPSWRADEHEVNRWCRLLAWHGVPTDPTDLGLRRPAPGRNPTGVTLLHPGSKIPGKRWPVERFAALGRQLAGTGHQIVITGDATEQPLARRVAQLAGLPAHTVRAGRTDLRHLAGLVAHARLLISGDTGIAHLATAYGTPSVVLFGPHSPTHWGPPPERTWHRSLGAGGGGDCPDRDGAGPHPTLAAINVDQVLVAVAEVERMVRATGATAA